MKRYIKGIVSFIVVGIIIIIFLKYKHSLSEILKIIDYRDDIPDNIYIKIEIVDNIGSSITEIYKKNDIIYQHTYKDDIPKYEDQIWNLEEKKYIEVNHIFKYVKTEAIKGSGFVNPITEILIARSEEFRNTDKKYKYHGKEVIDGKKYLKFSLTSADYIERIYYYIDIQAGNIYKEEYGTYYNNKFELYSTTIYTYLEDIVKDDDILKFNINNYQDYKYIEE